MIMKMRDRVNANGESRDWRHIFVKGLYKTRAGCHKTLLIHYNTISLNLLNYNFTRIGITSLLPLLRLYAFCNSNVIRSKTPSAQPWGQEYSINIDPCKTPTLTTFTKLVSNAKSSRSGHAES